MAPKFFQIGFNKCGTTFIARLFEMNDIPVVHWLEGDLAEDIAYSKLTGRPPLQKWADNITAFTDMESVRFLNMPIVEAFKEYEYLDAHFPGSVFLLNTRNMEDWIISRYMHRGGGYARACAQLLGVSVGDLADIWKEDWYRHLRECRTYFDGRPEFIEINIDEAEPEDYRKALSPWFDLKRLPRAVGEKVRKKREAYLPRLAEMLTATDVTDAVSDTERKTLAAALSEYCTPAEVRPDSTDFASGARMPVHFNAASGELRSRGSELLPIKRGANGRYYADPAFPALRPIASAVNDIAEVMDHGEYWLDMRPDCLAGSETGNDIPWPILAPSRRTGAANVFLWPMPWLHRLGTDGLPGVPLRKEKPFENKIDRAVWRGDIAGYARGAEGPDLSRPLPKAIQSIMATGEGSPRFEEGLNDLSDNSRLDFIMSYGRSEDIDIVFEPNGRTRKALRKTGMSPFLSLGNDGGSPFDYRYIVSLGGSPSADDFLRLANSESVVLKEEDGWEMYHSGAFHPWEHYIPLAWGAPDLRDKLDWARRNPEECRKISHAARNACLLLADPLGRNMQLTAILDAYRAATGQVN